MSNETIDKIVDGYKSLPKPVKTGIEATGIGLGAAIILPGFWLTGALGTAGYLGYKAYKKNKDKDYE